VSHQLPDTQASRPDVAVGLSQVGVTDVEKLVKIERDDERPWIFMAEFSVFVDLPSGRKGIDMSRNMEVIDEVLEAAVSGDTSRIEEVCGDAAERLIAKHDYTSVAEVEMSADFVTHEDTPASNRPTQSTATVVASATATEEGTREEIGAEVTGMTVCPCSQGMSEARAREQLRDLEVDDETIEAFLDEVPQPGHSQRGHATLTVEDDGSPDVDLFDIIDIARNSMSARIYNYAKRPDEDHMTYSAHSDAKFVEDCVRSLAEQTVDQFDHLDDDVVVHMRQSNDESIHQHNAHAEREVRLGRLRDEMAGVYEGVTPGGDPQTNGH